MASDRTSPRRVGPAAAYALAVASDVSGRLSRRLAATDGGLTLEGDRNVEWSFCLGRLRDAPARTLDFGAGNGFLSLAAAQRGHDVVALDRQGPELDYEHERVTWHQGDILERPLADRRFDQILNCSSVEHVGLPGRYGSFEREDGDLEAMAILAGMLEPGSGTMLLTVPVGPDLVCSPHHRIYGEERLPRLIDRFDAVEEQFWHKDPAARLWRRTSRETALATEGSRWFYALGLFELRTKAG